MESANTRPGLAESRSSVWNVRTVSQQHPADIADRQQVARAVEVESSQLSRTHWQREQSRKLECMHRTFTQCRFNVGPASQTLDRHQNDFAWTSGVYRATRRKNDKAVWNLAPVAETGFSHRLTAYKIVGHFFGLSYQKISESNQVKNSFF